MSLSQRLQALSDTYKQTISLVQELQKFPNGSSPLSDDLDEQRLELANTCHQNLKDAEESLELLRQEVEDFATSKSRRRTNTSRDEERERNATTVSRLTEDIRSARGAFRRAQLQSKKNLDARKQKEREELFAVRRSGANGTAQPPARQRGQEKLTQDEIAQNAADDVTRALRRTHALLSSNLQQSQFAQQTLEESQEQLASLAERYTGTTDMLQKSRGLVKTLLTSQKSDTWYLQTSVYILLATIAWLVFRRLLYGPLWWFVWLPVKWAWWGLSLVFGGVAARAGSGVAVVKNDTLSVSSSARLNMPTNIPGRQSNHHVMPSKGTGWGEEGVPDEEVKEEEPPSPEMVEQVKKIVNEAKEGTLVDRDEEQQQPKNTKKRMMDMHDEQARMRDEL